MVRGGSVSDEESSFDEDEMQESEGPPPTTVNDVLECDYDEDCSNLFKAIEMREWNGVATFIDTGYWPGHFFKDTASPLKQARTWVTRYEEAEEDGEPVRVVKWSQLPIHLALVCEAPVGIIRRLAGLFPEGLKSTDDEHMLPLHLALRHGSNDKIIDLLIDVFPGSVDVPGKENRTADLIAYRCFHHDKATAAVRRDYIVMRQKHGDKAEYTSLQEYVAVHNAQDEDNQERAIAADPSKVESVAQSIARAGSGLLEKIGLVSSQEKEEESNPAAAEETAAAPEVEPSASKISTKGSKLSTKGSNVVSEEPEAGAPESRDQEAGTKKDIEMICSELDDRWRIKVYEASTKPKKKKEPAEVEQRAAPAADGDASTKVTMRSIKDESSARSFNKPKKEPSTKKKGISGSFRRLLNPNKA